jgi:hypothetical protein
MVRVNLSSYDMLMWLVFKANVRYNQTYWNNQYGYGWIELVK